MVLYADGNLYFRYQDNVIALIEANPEEDKLKGKFTLPKRSSMSGEDWPYPVIVDGKLYIRHSDILFVYDIKSQLRLDIFAANTKKIEEKVSGQR